MFSDIDFLGLILWLGINILNIFRHFTVKIVGSNDSADHQRSIISHKLNFKNFGSFEIVMKMFLHYWNNKVKGLYLAFTLKTRHCVQRIYTYTFLLTFPAPQHCSPSVSDTARRKLDGTRPRCPFSSPWNKAPCWIPNHILGWSVQSHESLVTHFGFHTHIEKPIAVQIAKHQDSVPCFEGQLSLQRHTGWSVWWSGVFVSPAHTGVSGCW